MPSAALAALAASGWTAAGALLAASTSAVLLGVLAQAFNKAKLARVAKTETVFFMLTVLLSVTIAKISVALQQCVDKSLGNKAKR